MEGKPLSIKALSTFRAPVLRARQVGVALDSQFDVAEVECLPDGLNLLAEFFHEELVGFHFDELLLLLLDHSHQLLSAHVPVVVFQVLV